jgi:protein associated with RNAse G/E
VLDAEFDQDIEHSLLGTIACGTLSTEYYWLDRWYNVFRFSDPQRTLKNFYCNVNMPPSFDGEVLRYVDLDVDLLVGPDLSYQILDLDDFEANATIYNYPSDVRENVHRAVNDLVQMIETRAFPFSVQ